MEINLDIVELEERISELSYTQREVVKKMEKHIELMTDGRIEPLSELAVAMCLYRILSKKK